MVDFPDAFYGYADQIVGQFAPTNGQQEQFGLAFEKGNPLVPCVNEAIAALQSNGTLHAAPGHLARRPTPTCRSSADPTDGMAGEGGPSPELSFEGGPTDPRYPPPSGDRGSKLFGGGDRGARNVWIAVASTLIFFGVVAILIVRSPGWPEFKASFFDGAEFRYSFPTDPAKFVRNISIFCIAEVFVLLFALFLAVLRSLPGPVFTPLQDLLGRVHGRVPRHADDPRDPPARATGCPSLELQGVPTSEYFWAIVALVARLLRVRRRGVPGGYPIGASEPGRRGAVARALAAGSRCVTSSCRRRSGG